MKTNTNTNKNTKHLQYAHFPNSHFPRHLSRPHRRIVTYLA